MAATPLCTDMELDAQPAPATQVPVGRRQLVGVVRDAKGGPIEGVSVQVSDQRTVTDARGAFATSTGLVDTASISLRRVGFEPLDALLIARNGMWDTVVVQMDANARRLADVRVTDTYATRAGPLRGFEERKARGLGTFVTRDEIVDRGSAKLSDILRSKRGVTIVRGRVRFSAFVGSRSAVCQPIVWLDGTKALGLEVDEIYAQTVEAVEMYPNFSTIPLEFQTVGSNTTPCGTIVIWTRIPNSKNR
jgi:hypothetical protein